MAEVEPASFALRIVTPYFTESPTRQVTQIIAGITELNRTKHSVSRVDVLTLVAFPVALAGVDEGEEAAEEDADDGPAQHRHRVVAWQNGKQSILQAVYSKSFLEVSFSKRGLMYPL